MNSSDETINSSSIIMASTDSSAMLTNETFQSSIARPPGLSQSDICWIQGAYILFLFLGRRLRSREREALWTCRSRVLLAKGWKDLGGNLNMDALDNGPSWRLLPLALSLLFTFLIPVQLFEGKLLYAGNIALVNFFYTLAALKLERKYVIFMVRIVFMHQTTSIYLAQSAFDESMVGRSVLNRAFGVAMFFGPLETLLHCLSFAFVVLRIHGCGRLVWLPIQAYFLFVLPLLFSGLREWIASQSVFQGTKSYNTIKRFFISFSVPLLTILLSFSHGGSGANGKPHNSEHFSRVFAVVSFIAVIVCACFGTRLDAYFTDPTILDVLASSKVVQNEVAVSIRKSFGADFAQLAADGDVPSVNNAEEPVTSSVPTVMTLPSAHASLSDIVVLVSFISILLLGDFVIGLSFAFLAFFVNRILSRRRKLREARERSISAASSIGRMKTASLGSLSSLASLSTDSSGGLKSMKMHGDSDLLEDHVVAEPVTNRTDRKADWDMAAFIFHFMALVYVFARCRGWLPGEDEFAALQPVFDAACKTMGMGGDSPCSHHLGDISAWTMTSRAPSSFDTTTTSLSSPIMDAGGDHQTPKHVVRQRAVLVVINTVRVLLAFQRKSFSNVQFELSMLSLVSSTMVGNDKDLVMVTTFLSICAIFVSILVRFSRNEAALFLKREDDSHAFLFHAVKQKFSGVGNAAEQVMESPWFETNSEISKLLGSILWECRRGQDACHVTSVLRNISQQKFRPVKDFYDLRVLLAMWMEHGSFRVGSVVFDETFKNDVLVLTDAEFLRLFLAHWVGATPKTKIEFSMSTANVHDSKKRRLGTSICLHIKRERRCSTPRDRKSLSIILKELGGYFVDGSTQNHVKLVMGTISKQVSWLEQVQVESPPVVLRSTLHPTNNNSITENLTFAVLDDNLLVRRNLERIVRSSCGVDPERIFTLGATLEESLKFPELLLAEKIDVAIVDENLEYGEMHVSGTELVRLARRKGFKGCAVLHSASEIVNLDPCFDGRVEKTTSKAEIVQGIQRALAMSIRSKARSSVLQQQFSG